MPPAARDSRRVLPPGTFAAQLMATLIVVAPQLLGGATPETAVVICSAASAVSVATAITVGRSERGARPTSWAVWAAAFATLWTGFQRLPLPCNWISEAWPDLASLTASLRPVAADALIRCTISRAPGATSHAFMLAASIWATLAASTALTQLGHGKIITRSIAWSGVAMALVALTHTALDADRVFGVYTPRNATPGLLLAPLLNGNHLAALCGLCLPMTLGASIRHARAEGRLLWGAAAALLAITIGLSLSRGGLLGGTAAAVLFLLGRRSIVSEEGRDTPTSRRATQGILALSAALVLAAIGQTIAPEFADTSSARDKAEQIGRFLLLGMQHPWLGVGRGAFGDVSPAATSGTLRALFAENLPVQWICEWGVPASLLIMVGFAACARPHRKMSDRTWATWCGLFGLVIHEVADFSLELPAVALVAAAAFGTISRRGAGSEWPSARTSLQLASFCAIASALAMDARVLQSRDRPHVLSTLRQTADIGSDMREPAEFASALGDFPLDPAIYTYAAGTSVRGNSPLAAQWLNLAMERAPTWSSPHVQAAAWLEGQGRTIQAAEEHAIAASLEPRVAGYEACAFVRRHPQERIASRLIPEGSAARPIAEQIAQCLTGADAAAQATGFLREMVSRFPESVLLRERLASTLVRAGNIEEGTLVAALAQSDAPDSPAATATYISALVAQHDPDRAWSVYSAASSRVQKSRAVLTEMLAVAVARRDSNALVSITDALTKQTENPADGAVIASLAANAFLSVDDTGHALAGLQAAYTRLHDPSLLERLHQIASDAGLADVALRAALELCHVRHRAEVFCNTAPSR